MCLKLQVATRPQALGFEKILKQKGDLRKLFDALDVDRSGSLEPAELSMLLFGKVPSHIMAYVHIFYSIISIC